jgi:hypothetical protein
VTIQHKAERGANVKRVDVFAGIVMLVLLISGNACASHSQPSVGNGANVLPNDIEVTVKGDEALLDSVWDKVKSSITDIPEGAIMTGKFDTGSAFVYRFFHYVNGYRVDGDRFVVVIGKEDRLRRKSVEFHPLINDVGSAEAVIAGTKPMIWSTDVPKVAPPPEKPAPDAEAVLINPNNHIYVWDKRPAKYQPCWILYKDSQPVIMDVATGKIIGHFVSMHTAN